MSVPIRPATPDDLEAIWAIFEPVLREGETYGLPRDWSRAAGLAYWSEAGKQVFVAEEAGEGGCRVIGAYYLKPNQLGGGGHVANCGYITAPRARGRGVARAMGRHSLVAAKAAGFRAIQFNCVVSTNMPAMRLWPSLGFEIVGTLPGAFIHPELGAVDAYVMYQRL
ncbi:MAG: GNAT family N-acetyltransferase [Neomegalonema sp.]|nr:GNAT family N-acetyltransferase [Neomegalonema sp.]